jgi:hypothetical protein
MAGMNTKTHHQKKGKSDERKSDEWADGTKKLGFTLKSPLGYNKQIKTAKSINHSTLYTTKSDAEVSKAKHNSITIAQSLCK